MSQRHEEFLPTRQSLLERLKRWDDQESWRNFFDLYWGILYSTAMKSGLNDSEAQDVVQDTIITVVKKIERFRYDPAVDSFKGWLLYLTRKRIALEYRRRARRERFRPSSETGARSAKLEVEEIADPAGVDLDAIWEKEWAETIWSAALARVKEQVALKQFQMFDLYVIKERPAPEVSRALGVTIAQVYLAKHRVSAVLKKELDRLKTSLE
jgi:RNA polymerase sigma factor (sigma-70 family)